MPQPILPPDDALAELLASSLRQLPLASTDPVPLDITADGVMFVDGELLVRGDEALARLLDVEQRAAQVASNGDWHRANGLDNVIRTLDILREEGHVAQPNHAFSGSACECGCGPHPSLATRLHREGVGSLLGGQPFRSQPFRSQPLRSQPFRSQPFRSQSQSPMSTARPAPGPAMGARTFGAARRDRPLVIVVDTGVAAQLPPLLSPKVPSGPDDPIVFGETDVPDADVPPDGYLDPVAGHGTFIGGVIQQLAPGCAQLHVRLMSRFGIVVEWDVGNMLTWVPGVVGIVDRDVIVSMSFGGPTLERPAFLEDLTAVAVAATGTASDGSPTGVALVAAAGNDGTCIPYYPAAWPTVVGVGGTGPDGPPEWTNYGSWVDACAPSTDLVSCFFTFNGKLPSINTVDEDDFPGWAYWSGTSFAVPCVVAAIARSIAVEGRDAPAAVEQTVRGDHLARIAGLGTVVNL